MLGIGVDLGGSHYEVGLIDLERGKLVRSLSKEINPDLHWRDHLEEIGEGIRVLLEEGNFRDKFADVFSGSLGIALPGNVSPDGNTCFKCPNLKEWRYVPLARALREILREKLGLDVHVFGVNDVNAAAYAEYKLSVKDDSVTMLYVAVGTGVGGGIISKGELIVGARGLAGEIGHLPLDLSPSAPLCGCGARGCLETYASAKGITRESERLLGEPLSPKELYDLAQREDERSKIAREIFFKAGYYLGVGIVAVSYVVDLDMVVLGGGVMRGAAFILPGIFSAIEERLKMRELKVEDFVRLGSIDRPQTIGAALIGYEKMREKKVEQE